MRIDDMDRILADWLESTAARALPDGFEQAFAKRVAEVSQRSPWTVRLGGALRLGGASTRRLALVALAVTMLIATIAAGTALVGALRGIAPPVPPDLRLYELFERPFTYLVPSSSDLQPRPNLGPDPDGLDLSRVAGFVSGPEGSVEWNNPAYGSRHQGAGGNPRGIVVVALSDAVVHPCGQDGPSRDGPSRAAIRTEPAGLVEDLTTVAGAGVGPVTGYVVDGRPALSARVSPSAQRCEPDVHVGNEHILLTLPSRIAVLDVDGLTVMIQVWARSEQDLEAWLPVGDAFLESISWTQ